MRAKWLTFHRPVRIDYYQLVLAVLYGCYSYWSKDIILSGTGADFSVPIHIVYWVIPLLLFGAVLLILSQWQSTEGSFGLELGRRAYGNFLISFILVMAILITFDAPETSAYTPGQLLIITLNLTAGEIVLRAVVMELMLKVFGKTVVGINLSFILSVGLYWLVQIPGGGTVYLPVSWGLAGSMVYYGTGSVLALVLLDSLIFLPDLHVAGHRLLALMVVVLYFALALSAAKLRLTQSQSRQVTDGST